MIESIKKDERSLDLYSISSTDWYELIINVVDATVVVVVAAANFFGRVFRTRASLNNTKAT